MQKNAGTVGSRGRGSYSSVRVRNELNPERSKIYNTIQSGTRSTAKGTRARDLSNTVSDVPENTRDRRTLRPPYQRSDARRKPHDGAFLFLRTVSTVTCGWAGLSLPPAESACPLAGVAGGGNGGLSTATDP